MAYDPIVLPAPVGGTSVVALGASSNAAVIVGQCTDSLSHTRACYWDGTGIHLLPNLAGGNSAGAIACSADALLIVGQAVDAGGITRPVVWERGVSWTIVQLADLGFSSGNVAGTAQGVSYDDGTIVGYVIDAGGFNQACAWNNNPTWNLHTLTGLSGNNSQATGVTVDGSTIVGFADISGGQLHGAKWTGGPTWSAAIDLGLPAGGNNAIAWGCSGNAGTIVGSGQVGGIQHALMWTAQGASVLTLPPGANGVSFARGVDQTGVYVGGYASFSGHDKPVLWTNGNPQVLDLQTGFTGAVVLGIGPDAATLFGATVTPSVTAAAWVGPPPPVINKSFLVCGNDWTISQPKTQIFGLDHLISQEVVGLADGVPIGPLTVQSDGSVILPFPASYVTLGLGYDVQLQTPYLDVGNPTVQGRRKDITAVTVRVDSSAAPTTGTNQPDGGSFTPTQVGPLWTNMQPSVTQDPQQFPGTYVNPSGQTVTLLFSGDFRANVQPGWDVRGQVAVEQKLPLPLSVVAVIPEVLTGDLPEQTISQQQGQGEEGQRGPGMWMLTSRARR